MALAGIGCHYMVTWMDRNTATFSHMGGEGAAWIGQAPFTERRHVFANLGDGTYFHSGLLAIRAAVAANVPITYKLLYNDAVAMTGGQPLDGTLTVPQLAVQLVAEGVGRIVVVTDGTERAYGKSDLPEGIEMRHRRELDAIQRELREVPGVTAIIYDQTCAAEKRRRRKRGKYPDPAVRVFINERVCEGCGDCGVQSNCMAVVPLETEYGRKRAIDQSACNKDYSCLDGLCPSFVTVEGGRLKKGRAMDGDESGFVEPRAPVLPDTAEPWNILIAGVGGSGVITIGALIGMAAHIDGKGVSVLDMTGLAQKGGAVFSHVRIADSPDDLHAVRIATGEADAVIAGDVIVAASREALIKMAGSRTRAIVNSCETPTAEFTRDPDWQFPLAKMQDAIRSAVGSDAATFIDATALATRLLGDAIGTNLFLLGHAWQQGLVPVSGAALERAIELNGTAVEANLKAFLWGRRAALNRPGVERYADPHRHEPPAPQTLAELIESRAADLTAYQDVAYAQRYRAQVDQWRAATADFQERVARNYHKLLAVKDEYEIARLYNDPAFREQIGELFEGDYEIRYHLAPPMISPVDPETGRPRKRAFGPWMGTAFRWLAKFKGLRGTAFDVFGKTHERRAERQLIADYEADLALALANNSAGNADAVRALLSWPDHVRGYGVVKTKSIAEAMQLRAAAREKLSR
jgi:indolepyruvate ferredoxin oxidoreductase